MDTLNAAIDLAAMIPDSFAFVGFTLAILAGTVAFGRWTNSGDVDANLSDLSVDHWDGDDAAFVYRDAA